MTSATDRAARHLRAAAARLRRGLVGRQRPVSKPRRRSRAGYSMVMLVIMVAVMTILTSSALPLWSGVNQREREKELIFRGLQYAEAIRVFQKRYGRYPVRLEELLEVKPRCIRQLYKDPMSDNGEWELVFAGGPAGRVGGGPNGRNPGNPNSPQGRGRGNAGTNNARNLGLSSTPGGRESTLPQSQSGLGGGKRRAVGPIAGVRSKAETDGSAFLVFMGQTSYDQWAFTVELVSGVASVPDRAPMVPNDSRFWRPFPQGVNPPITFTPQNNGQQGGPGADGRRGDQAPTTGFEGRRELFQNRGNRGNPPPGLPSQGPGNSRQPSTRPGSSGGGGSTNDG